MYSALGNRGAVLNRTLDKEGVDQDVLKAITCGNNEVALAIASTAPDSLLRNSLFSAGYHTILHMMSPAQDIPQVCYSLLWEYEADIYEP